MRKRIIYVLLFVFILIALLFAPLTNYLFKDFVISRLEKAFDINIILGKIHLKSPSKLAISNIEAVDKDGLAFIAKSADFKLDTSKLFKAKIALNCSLRNVELKGGLRNFLNELLKPLAVAPQDAYKFDDINGIMIMGRKRFEIHGLKAQGPDFKLSGDIVRANNKENDYDIEFNINKRVLNLSEDQKIKFLIDEDGDGWYPIRLSMKEDPKKPTSIFFSSGGIELRFPREQ